MGVYNPYSLEGKTILVTGASSGIGRATAIECSKLGARLVLTGRNDQRLKETLDVLEGAGHSMIVADLLLPEDIERLVAQIDKVDGVVNNAGITSYKLLSFYKPSDFDAVFGTNTFAPMLLMRYLIKSKKIEKGGSVVITSSISSRQSDIGNGIYGSSKAAISAYMRYAAMELSSKSIRVNAVLPGMVETPLIQDGDLSPEDLERDKQKYPLGRYGHPEEIAWAIIYLLSDAAAWVTGSEFVIDGGLTLR